MQNNKKTINLLWTGGWDSTYRLVELSRQNVTIQPIYCCDPGRTSTQIEKENIEKIRNALIKREGTIATILPITYIEIDNIPANEKITEAFKYISEKVEIGSQYEWLARLTQVYPDLEIGFVKPSDKPIGIHKSISMFGKIKSKDGMKVLDCDNSSEEFALLLGGFKFPLYDLTELDMKENIQKWGYEDIMQMIWFCYFPIKGKPCGLCSPCQQKMNRGMTFLLTKKGQKRFKMYKFIRKCFGKKIADKSKFILRRL